MMARELTMDEAQKAKFTDTVAAYDRAMKAWEAGANGQKFQSLSKEQAEARKAQDKEKAKGLSEQIRPLRKEREELATAQRTQVMGVLTDEQKATWAGVKLYYQVVGRYKKLDPQDEQKKRIREICAEAIKTMPASADRKAHNEARRKLYADVEQKVLTEAQRDQWKAANPPKPPPQPKEPKARKKAGKADATPVITE